MNALPHAASGPALPANTACPYTQATIGAVAAGKRADYTECNQTGVQL